MTHYVARSGLWITVVLSTALIGIGCATEDANVVGNPTEPRAMSARHSAARDYSYVTNGRVTIADGSTSYTLDPATQLITRNDGVIVSMDADQTATMLSAFMNIVNADSLVSALEASPPPPDSGGDNCMETNTCYEAGINGGASSGNGGSILIRLANADHRVLHGGSKGGTQFGSFGHPLARGAGAATKGGSSPTVVDASGTNGIDCLSLALQIDSVDAIYQEKRSAFMSDMTVPFAIGAVGTGLRAGTIVMPEFDVAAWGDVLVHAMDIEQLKGQLEVMAGFYSEGGCWSNQWVDNSDLGSTIPMSPSSATPVGDVELSCQTVYYDVSVDGGATWTETTEDDCEWVYVE